MKRLVSLFCLGIIVCFSVQSCNTRIGDFTGMSTKNFDLGSKYVKTGTFEAEHAAWSILMIIPTGIPELKTAVDRCIEAGGGEFTTNVVLTYKYLPLLVVSKQAYGIKADIWKKASTGDLRDPNKEIYNLTVNSDGTRELISSRSQDNHVTIYNGSNATIESN